MPSTAHRPYFKSSIVQLENLFEQARSDIDVLRMLDHELGYRSTVRAASLRSKVSDLLANSSAGQVEEAIGDQFGNGFNEPPTAIFTRASNEASLKPPKSSISGQSQTEADTVIAPAEELGDLPSFSIPKNCQRANSGSRSMDRAGGLVTADLSPSRRSCSGRPKVRRRSYWGCRSLGDKRKLTSEEAALLPNCSGLDSDGASNRGTRKGIWR